MRQSFLSLVIFVGFIISCSGQGVKFKSWPFSYQKVSNEFTVKIRGNQQNLLEIKTQEIVVSTDYLDAIDQNSNSFFIYTSITKPTDLAIIYKITGGQSFLTIDGGLGTPEGFGQKLFYIKNVGDLDKQIGAKISITIVDPLGNRVGDPYEVPISIFPKKKNEATETCSQKLTSKERLDCYNALLETISGNAKTDLEQLIGQLISEKERIDGLVFKLEPIGKSNQYKIVSSSTIEWQPERFELGYNSFVASINGDKWRVKSSSSNALVTIRHKDWPSYGKTIKIPYYNSISTPPNNKSENKAQNNSKISITQDSGQEKTGIPDSSTGSTNPIDTINPIDKNKAQLVRDSLWADSISPLLRSIDLPGFINPSDQLIQHLNNYLLEGPSVFKKGIACTILYRLWVILPILFLTFILRLIFRRPRKRKETVDLSPDLMENNYPSIAIEKESEMSKSKELEIEIEEVEEAKNGALVEKLSLTEMETHPAYLPINLKECWENTATEQVLFKKESIHAIAQMLETYNAYSGNRVEIENLPEIGGFMLGHVYDKTEGIFDISIEQFVPITPESNDRYTVKFGDQAWIELDDAIKAFPGLKLVGWFHTHPGHGLFLSEADLREHRQLFRERYQIALEIDPTTPKKDTAFFTWTKDQDLNNRSDRRIEWWSFLALEAEAS